MIYHDLSSFSLLKSYVGAKSVSCSQADKKNACWFHIPFCNWFLFFLSPYQPALTSARPTADVNPWIQGLNAIHWAQIVLVPYGS